MEGKVKYILLAAPILVVLLYLLKKRMATTSAEGLSVEEKTENAMRKSASLIASAANDSVRESTMTVEDEEYNMAREEYRKLANKYPPSSWTKAMIESWIEEQEKKNEAIKKYVNLVSENENYVQDELSGDETLSQIEALLTKADNQIKAGKKQERTKYITELVGRFRSTLQAPNYGLMSAKKKNSWDESTLNEMLKLSTEEKREFNSIFKAKGGSGKIPDYFNQAKSKWRNRETVYDAIVKGNANTGRLGASTATKVKNAFASL